MKVISKAIRDSARDQDCTLRLPGICNFDTATTVLAHVPCGHSGVGMKGPDVIAVYACSDCHDALDERTRTASIDGWDVIRALAETQLRLIQKGLIKVKGVAA